MIQYDDFSFTTDLYVAQLEIQVHSMLCCLCPKIRDIIACTMLGEPISDVFAMKKAFTDHFICQVNRLYKSLKSLCPAAWGDNRCIFPTLQTLVKGCNYQSFDI